MMRAVLYALVLSGLALVTAAGASTARAQTGYVTDSPPVSVQPMPALPTATNTSSTLDYDQYRLDTLRDQARRSRNALIGLSAATVVGAVLLFPGIATQCESIQNFDSTYDQYQCSPGGWALVSIGGTLFAGGLTGVLITGIMFGVRQGKIRRLEDRIAFQKSRAVQWDPLRGSFVF